MPESLIWTRPDGPVGSTRPPIVLDLNDGVNIKLRHHDGFGIPELEHAVSGSPGVAGDYWFGVQYPARTISLDLVLYANSLAALQNLRASVISAFNPSLYSGTLKLTQTNGVQRWMYCALAESLPMPTTQHVGQRAMLLTIRLRSIAEPFWFDPVLKQQTVITGVGTTGNFMVSGFQFAFTITQAGAYTDTTIEYPGQVPTPVEVTLNGPGIEPVLRNVTLGRAVGFIGSGLSIVQGEQLYVNMDPRARAVLYGVPDPGTGKPTGNGWPYLRESSFWWLQPGANALRFEVSGSAAPTSLTMKYYERYLGV